MAFYSAQFTRGLEFPPETFVQENGYCQNVHLPARGLASQSPFVNQSIPSVNDTVSTQSCPGFSKIPFTTKSNHYSNSTADNHGYVPNSNSSVSEIHHPATTESPITGSLSADRSGSAFSEIALNNQLRPQQTVHGEDQMNSSA
jgi:hypothetical protein